MPTKIDVPVLNGGAKVKTKKMKVSDMKNIPTQKPKGRPKKIYKGPQTEKRVTPIVIPDESERVPEPQPLPETVKKPLEKEIKEEIKEKPVKEKPVKEKKEKPVKEEKREFVSKETSESVQGISKSAFNTAVNWLTKNEYITKEQSDKAKKFLKEQGANVTLTLDTITESLPFISGVLGMIPQTSVFGKAIGVASPLIKKGRRAFKELTGLGINDKVQLKKNIKLLQSQNFSNTKIKNELKKLTGGTMTNQEFLDLLDEAEKIVGKEPMKERTYKSGNKLRWVEALRLWNSDKERYCIPKKGTKEYNEVIEIMKTGNVKKPEMVKVQKKTIPKVDVDSGIMKETKEYQDKLRDWIKSGKKGPKPKLS